MLGLLERARLSDVQRRGHIIQMPATRCNLFREADEMLCNLGGSQQVVGSGRVSVRYLHQSDFGSVKIRCRACVRINCIWGKLTPADLFFRYCSKRLLIATLPAATPNSLHRRKNRFESVGVASTTSGASPLRVSSNDKAMIASSLICTLPPPSSSAAMISPNERIAPNNPNRGRSIGRIVAFAS
jgi:hypothetical protein